MYDGGLKRFGFGANHHGSIKPGLILGEGLFFYWNHWVLACLSPSENLVSFWERVFKRAVKDTRRGNPASIVSGMEAMRPVPVGLAQVARTGRSGKLTTGNI